MKTYFRLDMDAFFVSVEELYDPALALIDLLLMTIGLKRFNQQGD